MSKNISRRSFLRQLNCAAVGSSAILNTLLNLRLANSVAAQGVPFDNKALVCIFLSGGCDSFNVLVPYEQTRYNTYAITRGAFGTDGGLALSRNAVLPLAAPASDYALHPSCVNLQQMANGTGNFVGKRRLAFLANVGTLIQPITKAQFNNWEDGNDFALPVPKALFSHSDQIEQWQTAVPQGLAQIERLGRTLRRMSCTTPTMRVRLHEHFARRQQRVSSRQHHAASIVVTPSGSLSFDGEGSANGTPLQLKNAGLRSTLDQHYTNLLTESFSRSPSRATTRSSCFRRNSTPPMPILAPPWTRCYPANNYLATTLKAVVKTPENPRATRLATPDVFHQLRRLGPSRRIAQHRSRYAGHAR
jgi:uncharacterized protein (DUF1501 family)